MIYVTDEMYVQLAALFFEELEKSGNYFNGRVDCDTPEFYSTLTCSAIVYRSQNDESLPVVLPVEKVVSVWWDFSVCIGGELQDHDFSWSEFTQFFPYA